MLTLSALGSVAVILLLPLVSLDCWLSWKRLKGGK